MLAGNRTADSAKRKRNAVSVLVAALVLEVQRMLSILELTELPQACM
jgi:hypothetical protein